MIRSCGTNITIPVNVVPWVPGRPQNGDSRAGKISGPHFRARINSTVAARDGAETRSGTSLAKSKKRTSVPSKYPYEDHGLKPPSHSGRLTAPKEIAAKPGYAATSVVAASFSGRPCEGSSIPLCSRDAENPATTPTMSPATGPRTSRNGSARDAPVITQSRTPEKLNPLDVHEKADHDTRDDTIVAARTATAPVTIPSTAMPLPTPGRSHTD